LVKVSENVRLLDSGPECQRPVSLTVVGGMFGWSLDQVTVSPAWTISVFGV
jgi:hypothetical protein